MIAVVVSWARRGAVGVSHNPPIVVETDTPTAQLQSSIAVQPQAALRCPQPQGFWGVPPTGLRPYVAIEDGGEIEQRLPARLPIADGMMMR